MLDLLLPDPTQVKCDDVVVLEDLKGIELQLVASRSCSVCPICQTETNKVHSRYSRCLADLPWADVSVSIRLRVRRFFCVNTHCPRAVFCEQLPGVTEPWARRTERLARAQCAIGLALGGAAGARLSATLLMKAGIDLLLNLVRRMVQLIAPTPRVLGVDDWAKRKGQTYGTILVDLEQSRIIDLLPDRTADSLIQWLEERPGIEIVSRDRSQTYADAISQAAPEAIQVADRWHLLKNLSDALFKILQEEYGTIKKQLAEMHEEEGAKRNQVELTTVSSNVSSQQLTPAEQRRKERMEFAQRLHKQGWTQKDIARYLNINRKTVSRYLRSFSVKVWRHRKSRRLLDPFKPYILKRWNEGCHNAAQLFREIDQQGFTGGRTTVRNFVRQLRQASGLPPKGCHENGQALVVDPTKQPPTLRSLTWLILKQPDKRSEKDERMLAQMSVGQSRLITTIEMARKFSAIVRQQKSQELDDWLDQASHSNDRIWKNFAASLKQDYDAVRAALLFQWSNGPTEGHVNRLKCVKRQMYGRANLDLLRQRLVGT